MSFRALGGAQSILAHQGPLRRRLLDRLGRAGERDLFALTQDYARLHGLTPPQAPVGRMVAIVGDAELDEGNIYEALLEG
ncbi:MAG: hypothetical protein U1E17_09025 [Geminicoccaceae bacterium]